MKTVQFTSVNWKFGLINNTNGDNIMKKLLTAPHGNTKTNKSLKLGYANYILHLAPANESGHNVCPMATAGCKAACLNTAGRAQWIKDKAGNMNPIHTARIRKTKMFFEDRSAFLAQLKKEIESAIKSAKRKGLTPVFRLNGTSDIRFENYGIIQSFPDVQFYDYTKIPNRRNLPANYVLVFSLADGNKKHAQTALKNGLNVSAVFRSKLPKTYLGKPVINADEHDLRFLDPKGSIVGLIAKGKAKQDTTGFVID